MMTTTGQQSERVREGLMLCMMLASAMDGKFRREETREMAIIVDREPEFSGESSDEFERLLARAEMDLHRNPEQLMELILELLKDENSRRRGLEFATRVAVSDGFVTEDEVALLQRLCQRMGLDASVLRTNVERSQRHLVRLMMLYLVNLAATADGVGHPAEYEQMIPIVLSLPVFQGVTTDEFGWMCRSVRTHLPEVRSEWGIDYVTGTIVKAAEIMKDDSLKEQALKVVTSGIMADGELHEAERKFANQVAEKLGLEHEFGEEIVLATVRESQELRKI